MKKSIPIEETSEVKKHKRKKARASGKNAESVPLKESDEAAANEAVEDLKVPSGEGEEDLLDRLQRLAAEFENYKKKNAREYSRGREDGMAQVMEAILPIFDSLALAVESCEKKPGIDALFKGVQAVRRQLQSALEALGLEEIRAEKGDPLDPNVHEAILAEFSDEFSPGRIIDSFQTGYSLKGKLIRAAKVKVAREPTEKNEKESPGGASGTDKSDSGKDFA